MDPLLDRLDREASALVVPPPRIDLGSWIEGHVVLPEGMTSTPGKVRLWPYQRGICDAISDPEVERITVVKSARLGYTTLLTGMIASYVANDPSQILVVLPTDDDCRDYVVSDIEPVFAASPALVGKLSDDANPNSRNTIMSRRFPGGSIKFVGAKSPRKLRRHSARVLIVDEAAAMEADAGEGSVISRAITRTMGFADRKIIEGSTLTDDTSNVLVSYAHSNRSRFEVPCPACGTFTFIEWRHIEWESDRPETAAYRCPHCHELTGERHKPAMVAAGRWIAQNPAVKAHVGFLINALVSPLEKASWAVLAAEFLASKDDPDLLKVFVNNVLAEPWTGDTADVDENALRRGAEPFGLNMTTDEGEARPIPAEVLAITLGTDVQDDRLEVSVVGWSPTETFVLAHRVIWGSPGDPETWREHDDLTLTSWAHPHGGTLKVEAAIVDSGDGDWTQAVYDYCFPRARRRIMAGKGVGGTRPDWQPSPSTVKGGRLFIVGVDGLKTSIMDRLERGRLIRFSDTLEPVYFDQLVSERKVLRRVRGQPRRMWERKPGARAEALDCLVYAFAARRSLTLNFDHRRAAMAGQAPSVIPQPRSPRETNELHRYGTVGGVRVAPAGPRVPTSPREQAELHRCGTIGGVPAGQASMAVAAPVPATGLPVARNPREAAEYRKSGTIGGVPAAPWHPEVKARSAAALAAQAPPPPSPGLPKVASWSELLGKSAAQPAPTPPPANTLAAARARLAQA